VRRRQSRGEKGQALQRLSLFTSGLTAAHTRVHVPDLSSLAARIR